MLKKFFLLSLLWFTVINLNAQPRKYVNDYLNLGVGGRGTAMSGAQIASVSDVTAAFWNPACLNYIKSDFQVGFMHSEYFSGIAKYDYLGTAFPSRNNKGTIGLSVIRYAIDDIPYTLNLFQADGSIDYSKIKAISSQDYAGLISYAQPLKIGRFLGQNNVSVKIGGNLKIIHRSIGTLANAWGGGLDLGLQANAGRWKLGAVVKDITTTYTIWSFSFTDKEKQVLAQTGNEIPSKSSEVAVPRIILGGGRTFPLSKKIDLLTEVNLDLTTDGKRYGNLINIKPLSIDPRIGAELAYQKIFYVRAGIGNFQRILDDKDTNNVKKVTLFQPTLGLGVKIKNFAIDYSFSSLNIESSALYSHFISLRIEINKKGYSETPEDQQINTEADEINRKIKKSKKQ